MEKIVRKTSFLTTWQISKTSCSNVLQIISAFLKCAPRRAKGSCICSSTGFRNSPRSVWVTTADQNWFDASVETQIFLPFFGK
ncbi:unnamed protein product [Chondrus crispus]|uniref:Uncharacterized protein n=1 Tax=Chondrus crispus TaxID=2769 RepID=R7QMC8_CHOCR|nr:unnamed protein product [Chondrus crispus]CDF38525.1 unnamed protein product [Chondrus crispus]|eukprot:XP_005718418.1 unnamed protein product [Chondrus crispus]